MAFTSEILSCVVARTKEKPAVPASEARLAVEANEESGFTPAKAAFPGLPIRTDAFYAVEVEIKKDTAVILTKTYTVRSNSLWEFDDKDAIFKKKLSRQIKVDCDLLKKKEITETDPKLTAVLSEVKTEINDYLNK